jgi:hypothetical protein
MKIIVTSEQMFGKYIEECNPIERSILQDYNCKINWTELEERLKINALRKLLQLAKDGHSK